MKRRVIAVVTALVVGLVPSLARAGTTGSLSGAVLDMVGKPVAGAIVSAVSPEEVLQSRTDAHGDYAFLGIIPGNYRLRVTKDGFETEDAHDISVMADTAPYVKLTVRWFVAAVIDRALNPARLVRPGNIADVYMIPSAFGFVTAQPQFGRLLDLIPGVQPGALTAPQ